MTDVARRPADGPVTVSDVRPRDFAGHVREAMSIYVDAMGYTSGSGVQRGTHALRHADYEGFRCRIATDARGHMLGFCYGYTSRPGQWWHDLVRRALTPDEMFWMDDCYELSELHVRPEAQGGGIGEALLRSLADGLPHTRMVLSTPEGENRAWKLYRRLGFVDLARNHLFPGDHRPFGVLGAELPFSPRPPA